MNNYANAFTEVNTILQELDEEEYNKIPPQVLQAIIQNQNEQYNYELDENLDLKQQPMLPETKAILFNLFRDYLATPVQKEKIIQMQKEERQKNELKKQQAYNTNVFQNNTNYKPQQNKTNNQVQLVEYKQNIFSKMLNFIKKLFHFGK